MRMHLHLASIVGLLLIPVIAFTQSSANTLTFDVPLNLTRLDPLISQVDVTCRVTIASLDRSLRGPNPGQIGGHVVRPVANQRIVETVNVTLTFTRAQIDAMTGQTVSYDCGLTGYSVGMGTMRYRSPSPTGWNRFDANHDNPAFRLSPTPVPLTGSFTW